MTAFPYADPSSQIENRNYLRPTQFLLSIARYPKITFFANTGNIPSLNFGVANQSTPLKDIPTPGDKIVFEDFSFRFLVDEDLVNYTQI